MGGASRDSTGFGAYRDRSKVDGKPTKELSLPGRFGEDPNPQFKGLVLFILMKDPKWKPRTCPFTENMKHPIAIFPVTAKLTSRKTVSHLSCPTTFGDPLEACIA